MPKLTPEQEQAVTGREPQILVSAAAGSGKTKVLIDRIVRLMEQGMSLDRMLVVTFTRAAAGEMRARLEDRLQDDPHLSRELDKLQGAYICTLDTYCHRMVRRYFQYCGIDPQFRLADESLRIRLWDEAMNAALDELYARAEEDASLRALTDAFEEREIAEILTALYTHLMSLPDPFDWLHRWALPGSSEKLLAQEEALLLFETRAQAGVMMAALAAMEQAADQGRMPVQYAPALESDRFRAECIFKAAGESVAALRRALADHGKAEKLASVSYKKVEDPQEAARLEKIKADYQVLRKAFAKAVADLEKLVPEQDRARLLAEMEAMQPAREGLEQAALLLHCTYADLKNRNSLMEFSDLEHSMLRLAGNEEVRQELRAMFDAVFVDEYQDISPLQESILQAVRRPENDQLYFYVGDVKQSIYRFRKADPGLITEKGARFEMREGATERKILLNCNFRSRERILYGVNRVFSRVMNETLCPPGYDSEGALVPGIPSAGDPPVEVHILPRPGKADARLETEARWAAAQILSMAGKPRVNRDGTPGDPLRFRDIAILMPRCKNTADRVRQILLEAGVPAYYAARADLSASEENGQLLALLRVLQDPEQDVPLLAVMRGPMFSFTDPELALIRAGSQGHGSSYRSAVRRTASQNEGPLGDRCRELLSVLERERGYLNSMPLQEYLWDVLSRSGLYAYWGAREGGALRQARLRLLCEKAGEYAETHVDGAEGFLNSLDRMHGSGEDNEPAILDENADVVHIMTVHASKGLQFPAVILMGLNDQLAKSSGKESAFSCHTDMGFQLRYTDRQAHVCRATLGQDLIRRRNRQEEILERGRLLYVAMTRAEERLIMAGTSSTLTYDAFADGSRVQPGKETVPGAASLFQWITDSLLPTDGYEEREGFSTFSTRKTYGEEKFSTFSTFNPHTVPWKIVFHKTPSESDGTASDPCADEERKRRAQTLLRLIGGDSGMAQPVPDRSSAADPVLPPVDPTPLKVGVTALCRALRAGEQAQPDTEERPETEATKALPFEWVRPRSMAALPELPAFLGAGEENDSLLRGTYTHLLLSTVSLEKARLSADEAAMRALVRETLEGCVKRNLIPADTASLADTDMVCRFLLSPLGKRMLSSPRTEREWSFCLRVTEPVNTTVQGIIDLCFLENGRWTLVDFKTDRVSAADRLWKEYEPQIGIYRAALEQLTEYPVGECVLYSLRLGEASVRK